jgi:peptidyl-tRNA hydrolase, PTH1 family
MIDTILIAGLGNPGSEYDRTPHNLGREIVEALASSLDLPNFEFEKKFNSRVTSGPHINHKLILVLPETQMNLSGNAVSALAGFHKITPNDIWIIHDDADIPAGNVRISLSGRSAGHHGLDSIMDRLGAADFWRFRLGIAPQEPLILPLEAYVLKKNAISEDLSALIIAKTLRLINMALKNGIAEAQKAAE